ncbi:MAG: GNAT family N-acetyltransferase [Pyrinomonadaceae bacterium]
MKILETERTILREIVATDAGFVLDLLNQPSFIKYIGDRQVRTLEQAADYIETRFAKSYQENGFGMYLVELKEDLKTSEIRNPKSEIGICGFVRRDTLPDPDLGFAFLPEFGKKGYALETARAMMRYGRETLNLGRVLAITTQDNENSVRLLEKLGFRFDGLIKMPGDPEELKLFSA